MTFQIKKATKSQAKLRMAMFGPSGGGKTMSSLRIATGLLEGTNLRIGVIDTERGSASKYSDRYDFDVIELDGKKDVATVTGAIRAFAEAGHGVLIIDSLTHAWQELLAEVDRLAKTRFKGNTWSAWSEGTPIQRSLVDAILDYPGHVIATMRSKTEWTTQSDGGKSKPVRVGLAPEQGKGIEYEFDVLMELSTSHVGEVIKDRTGKFQDVTIERPGEALGRELAAWLAEGEPVRAPEKPALPAAHLLSPEKAAGLQRALSERGIQNALAFASDTLSRTVEALGELTTADAKRVFEAADAAVPPFEPDAPEAAEGEFPPDPPDGTLDDNAKPVTISASAASRLHAKLGKVGVPKNQHYDVATAAIGRFVTAFSGLSKLEAVRVSEVADALADGRALFRDGAIINTEPPDDEIEEAQEGDAA